MAFSAKLLPPAGRNPPLISAVYEHFYGFTEPPFSLTPDPRFFYGSDSHQRALDELLHAIARREGFMLLTGDIGTGKTTLCRTLLDQLGRMTFSALVLNPFITEEELLKAILIDFGVVSKTEIRRGRLMGATKHELIEVLNQFLLSLSGIGASAVAVIDEAQNLPAATLEQIRVLTNLETDRHKLLQILLVGQLNLVPILKAPEMRQLDQRISRRCMLQALDRLETEGYIQHRMKTAGGETKVEFTGMSLDLVHRFSGGIPRLINVLCSRALEVGQHEGASVITPDLVRTAAQQVGMEPPRRRASDRRRAWLKRTGWRMAAAAAALLAIVVGASLVARYVDATLWPSSTTPQFSAGVPEPTSRPAAAPSATPARPLPPPLVTDLAIPPPRPAGENPGPVDPVRFFSILIGAFTNRADADRGAEALRAAGYLVRDVVQTEGRAEYRLLVGRYPDATTARRDAARIAQDPYFREATVVTGR